MVVDKLKIAFEKTKAFLGCPEIAYLLLFLIVCWSFYFKPTRKLWRLSLEKLWAWIGRCWVWFRNNWLPLLKKSLAWVWKRRLGIIFSCAPIIVFFLSFFFDSIKEFWEFGEEWDARSNRFAVLTLGAWGAFYGLLLSVRRINVSENNLFNDRLSRAIEALGHQEFANRRAGLTLLENLAKETPEEKNKELILQLLHNFIRGRAGNRRYDALFPSDEEIVARNDIVVAIKILFKIVTNPAIRLDKYSLDTLDLRQLEFGSSEWLRPDKWKSCILDAADLQGAQLNFVDLQGAHLWYANLQDAYLWDANLEDSKLGYANLQGANLMGAKLFGADLSSANLHGTNLSGVEGLKSVEGLTQGQFDKIIYDKYLLPIILEGLKLPEHRAYEHKGGEPYFIKSQYPESERPVYKVLEEERKAREDEDKDT